MLDNNLNASFGQKKHMKKLESWIILYQSVNCRDFIIYMIFCGIVRN